MSVKTGIEGLDRLLYGGIPGYASVMLEGPPGSGKTIMGMQYIWCGAEQKEPGMFIGLQELPEQLRKQMRMFGWDAGLYEKNGLLQLISIDPYALYYDMLETEGLFESMLDSIRCKRLVLDGMGMFSCLAADKREQRAVLYTLRNILRRKGITALLIHESRLPSDGYAVEHHMFDGVWRLRNRKKGRQLRRTIEVVKMRGTGILEGEHDYQLTDKGMVILPDSSFH